MVFFTKTWVKFKVCLCVSMCFLLTCVAVAVLTKHINECINVSVTTLSVLAIFLPYFQYFKMTKIKSVVPAKLRIIGLPVVTILVALMQILATANL